MDRGYDTFTGVFVAQWVIVPSVDRAEAVSATLANRPCVAVLQGRRTIDAIIRPCAVGHRLFSPPLLLAAIVTIARNPFCTDPYRKNR